MVDENFERDYKEMRFRSSLGVLIGSVVVILMLLAMMFAIPVYKHYQETGTYFDPAVRIIEVRRKVLVNDTTRPDIYKEQVYYKVEYITYDQQFWWEVDYGRKYENLETLEDAQEVAKQAKFLLDKTGSPYNDEWPEHGVIREERLIPFKGEK